MPTRSEIRPLSSIGLKVFFTTVPSSFLATLGDRDFGDVTNNGVAIKMVKLIKPIMMILRRG